MIIAVYLAELILSSIGVVSFVEYFGFSDWVLFPFAVLNGVLLAVLFLN